MKGRNVKAGITMMRLCNLMASRIQARVRVSIMVLFLFFLVLLFASKPHLNGYIVHFYSSFLTSVSFNYIYMCIYFNLQ